MEINIKTFSKLLHNVHLGGLIGECVLKEGKNGMNYINAIDLTNSLILSVRGKTKFEDFKELGLSDLPVLCKYLETASEDTEIKLSENRLVFKNKNGTFKYLLAQPDLIPTAVEEEDALKKLIEDYTHEITLEEEFQKNFAQSMALTKTNNVKISVGESIKLLGGLENEHQFTIPIGKPKVIKESRKEKKYELSIYGNHLSAVLNATDLSVRENLPVLLLKDSKPVVVKQGNNIWALTIIEN